MAIIVGLMAFFILSSPLGSPVLERLARYFYARKRYPAAASCYEKLFRFRELVDGAQEEGRMVALCYEKAGDRREAADWYSKIGDWAKSGQMWLDLGKTELAIQHFRQGNHPARLAYCYELKKDFLQVGEIYEKQLNNEHKALSYYEKASRKPEPFPAEKLLALLRMTRLYFKLNRTEQALATYQQLQRFLEQPELAAETRIQAELTSLQPFLKAY